MVESRTNFELFQAALQRHYEALCRRPIPRLAMLYDTSHYSCCKDDGVF